MRTIAMTAQWLERAPLPADGREDWYDTKVTGLGLRVSKTGKKVWFVQYRLRGDTKRRRLTLSPYPTMSLADARERAHEVLSAASKGIDPASEKQEERKAPTFAMLAADYIERHAKTTKRTWYKDKLAIDKDLIPAWGRLKAHEIRKRDVFLLLDKIVERGSPIQANRTLALARKIFNWGIGRDFIEANPCAQVKAPSGENERDRVLTEDEIRRLWNAWDQLDPVIGASFKVRLLTAQRGGEVDSMRWSDLDLINGWWTIPAEQAKNKLSHRVPVTEPVRVLLDRLRAQDRGSQWVFPSPKRTGQHISNVQHSAIRARELAGVADFKPHDLRRTAASYMASLGVQRLVISKVLNHVEPGVTRVYDRHSYDGEKRQALQAWAKRLGQILEEPNASD